MNELSILVPCPSNIDSLPGFIDVLSQYLMTNPADAEVIIITNENEKSIISVADYIQKKYPWLKLRLLQKKGESNPYGALIRFGLAYSLSRYAVIVSPYGEDDISIINEMLGLIRKGAQVVQASRYSSPDDWSTVPVRFRIYQYVYRFLTKLMTGLNISDSTYGFKMFDRVFIQSLGLMQNGYSICPEITLKALLAGGKVTYISSRFKTIPFNKGFRLYKEGAGYAWLLIRSFLHRIGIFWF